MGKVLERSNSKPKHSRGMKVHGFKLSAWLGRAFVSLLSPQRTAREGSKRRRWPASLPCSSLLPRHHLASPSIPEYLALFEPGIRTCGFPSTDGQRQSQAGRNKLHSLLSRKSSRKGS